MQQPSNAFNHWKYLSWYSVKVLVINVKCCQTIMTVMPNALKLFYDYGEKYAGRAILHVYVTAKRNFIIRIGETVLKYICTKNDEDLSDRHADNYRRVSVEEQLIV